MEMSIIKLEINLSELKSAVKEFHQNRQRAFENLGKELKQATSQTINHLLNAEMEIFLGREDQENNKSNGYRMRKYALKGIGAIKVKFPTDRKRKFDSKIIPKNEQIDPRLKEDIAVLHLARLSTRTLSMISNRLLGFKSSKQTVSNSLDLISEKAIACVLPETSFTKYTGDIVYTFPIKEEFQWVGKSVIKWMRNLNL